MSISMPDIPTILPTYQLPAIPISRAEFAALPFRDDEADGAHTVGEARRTREGYQNDVFFWVVNENGDGEWRRGPAQFTD